MVYRLISKPQAFDVIAAPNLFVDVLALKAGWAYPGDIGALGKNAFLRLFAPTQTSSFAVAGNVTRRGSAAG